MYLPKVVYETVISTANDLPSLLRNYRDPVLYTVEKVSGTVRSNSEKKYFYAWSLHSGTTDPSADGTFTELDMLLGENGVITHVMRSVGAGGEKLTEHHVNLDSDALRYLHQESPMGLIAEVLMGRVQQLWDTPSAIL